MVSVAPESEHLHRDKFLLERGFANGGETALDGAHGVRDLNGCAIDAELEELVERSLLREHEPQK